MAQNKGKSLILFATNHIDLLRMLVFNGLKRVIANVYVLGF